MEDMLWLSYDKVSPSFDLKMLVSGRRRCFQRCIVFVIKPSAFVFPLVCSLAACCVCVAIHLCVFYCLLASFFLNFAVAFLLTHSTFCKFVPRLSVFLFVCLTGVSFCFVSVLSFCLSDCVSVFLSVVFVCLFVCLCDFVWRFAVFFLFASLCGFFIIRRAEDVQLEE